MAKRNNMIILTPNEIQSLLEFCSRHLDNIITLEQDTLRSTTIISVTEDNEIITEDITDFDSWNL